MRWDRASKDESDKLKIPGSWLETHYYDALSLLFRVENALRIFVYVVLKNECFENWTTINITSDDANPGTIASIARRRKAQDDSFGYLGYPTACPFMHLTSGELIRLLTSDNLWRCFREYFPALRELVRTKLDEIGNVRNSLAHFRPLKPEDVELARQNATHILSGVEKVLVSLSNCEQIVPTNTPDEWYRELSGLGTELCLLRLYQSDNEAWIRCRFTYRCPIISTAKTDYSRKYRVLNISTSAILREFPVLRNNVTCLAEDSEWTRFQTEDPPPLHKDLELVFGRSTLVAKHKELKDAMESLLQLLASETELVMNDHLARGLLISATTVESDRTKSSQSASWYWDLDGAPLESELGPDDPPEFWGKYPGRYIGEDFISDTRFYPWMSAPVSPMFP